MILIKDLSKLQKDIQETIVQGVAWYC